MSEKLPPPSFQWDGFMEPPKPDSPREQTPETDEAERLFWEFDARRKGYSRWKGQPQSERDAFKTIIRSLRGKSC